MGDIQILIVEDNESIAVLLRDALEGDGFRTTITMDGEAAITTFMNQPCDLVILDLTLPKVDGFEVCRSIRKVSQVPILVLSALSDQADKIRCLTLGADDCLTKPFGMGELLAREKALLRRATSPVVNSKPVDAPFYYDDGYLTFDSESFDVKVWGRKVKLTPTEYKLLRELIKQAGTVREYDELLKKVWGLEYQGERSYLHDYISNLRHKIEPDKNNPQYIINITGVGYRFDRH